MGITGYYSLLLPVGHILDTFLWAYKETKIYKIGFL